MTKIGKTLPAETTANIHQHGFLYSVTEQSDFCDASFLSSTVNYNVTEFNIYGNGSQPLTVVSTANATYNNPHQFPVGISYVLVNGKISVVDEQSTKALAGMALRLKQN